MRAGRCTQRLTQSDVVTCVPGDAQKGCTQSDVVTCVPGDAQKGCTQSDVVTRVPGDAHKGCTQALKMNSNALDDVQPGFLSHYSD